MSEEQHNQDIIDTSGMSEGKRAALEMAESSRESHWTYPTFAGAMFMGQVPWDLVYPFPAKDDDITPEAAAWLDNFREFLRTKVDPDEIDRTGEIPDEVIAGLAEMGAFGIKIPKKYGGLGFSQTVYSRAAHLLGGYCGNTAALLSAHQSIGIPQPLLQFGTDEQKQEYLPRCAKGEISAFALTEPAVGSDPAKMTTSATPTEDGEHFLINGTKLWCTNGTKAKLLVVMAQTPPKEKRGRMVNQVSAFIVEADAPGVTITHRCRFMGLKALYNAVVEFKDVKVARKDIIAGEGKGLRVALTTLNTGRLTLPANCVGAFRSFIEMSKKWANERVQWGAPIGKHAAIADKIADMSSKLFAIESMTTLTSTLVDRKNVDIRVEAAICKMYATEEAYKAGYETMQIIGGRGFETAQSLEARGEYPYAIERAFRDLRINTIFEGSSEIMRLFIAREAMDPHLRIAGEAVNTQLPTGRRLKAAIKAGGFYSGWYPKQWLPLGGANTSGLEGTLAKKIRYVNKTTKKLARRMYHQMLINGPKMEQKQIQLGRIVDIGAELFAIAASVTRAQHLINEGGDRKEILALVDHFYRGAVVRINERFRGIAKNHDGTGYKLAQDVLGGYDWLTEWKVGEKAKLRAVPPLEEPVEQAG